MAQITTPRTSIAPGIANINSPLHRLPAPEGTVSVSVVRDFAWIVIPLSLPVSQLKAFSTRSLLEPETIWSMVSSRRPLVESHTTLPPVLLFCAAAATLNVPVGSPSA